MRRFPAELWIFAAFLVVFWLACNTTAQRREIIHANVSGVTRGMTTQGDQRFFVGLEFEVDGVHHSQTVVMDFEHYCRIKDLADVCLVPTVNGYEVRRCQD